MFTCFQKTILFVEKTFSLKSFSRMFPVSSKLADRNILFKNRVFSHELYDRCVMVVL